MERGASAAGRHDPAPAKDGAGLVRPTIRTDDDVGQSVSGGVRSEITEASRGAQDMFRRTYAEATLFIAPTLNDRVIVETADELMESMRAWRERGIMPYAITALRWPDETGRLWTTAVYRLVPGTDRIEWTARYDFDDPEGRAIMFASYAEGGSDADTDLLFVKPERPIAPIQLDAAKKAGGGGIAAFVWLNNALTSTSFSAKAEIVSRQVARSEGSPRMRWVIEVRPRRSSLPSMRKQFADVVRAAHAVRGHLRKHRVTGEKSVKVKPYVRGKGDAVQIKDYVVRDLEGT